MLTLLASLTLGVGVVGLVISLRRGALLTFFFQLSFLSLVTSQLSWFAFFVLQGDVETYRMGYSAFSHADAVVAALLFYLFQLGLLANVLFTPRASRSRMVEPATRKLGDLSEQKCRVNSLREWAVYLSILLIICPLMIINAGGIELFFLTPGSMVPGQTFLILALGALKWNILVRLMRGLPVSASSIFFFLTYLFFCLFTSRFLTVFALVQLSIAWHYFVRPLNIFKLLPAFFLIFFVVFVYGGYREVAHVGASNRADAAFIIGSIQQFLPTMAEWFFNNNTEIFSGVCDALRQLRGGAKLDFLIPELQAVFLLIPNFIRTDDSLLIARVMTDLATSGTRSNSVVASGFERYLYGLGVLGFLLYCLILLGFLHLSERSLRLRRMTFSSIAAVQAVNGLRGSLMGVLIFFGTAEYLASKVFSTCIKNPVAGRSEATAATS